MGNGYIMGIQLLEKNMKREKLNVVFNKEAVTAELKKYSADGCVSPSDVARAAMNYGLSFFEAAKESMTVYEFDGFILNLQELDKKAK